MAYTFSESIQKGILFLLKTDVDFFIQITHLVKEEYFEFPIHSAIFKAVSDYYQQYHKLPKDEYLIEILKSTTKFNPSEIEDELIIINQIKEITDNPEFYLDLIEKFARRESIKNAIVKSVELVKNDRIEEVEEIIKKATNISRNVDLGQEYWSNCETRWERTYNAQKKDIFPVLLPTISSGLDGGGLSRKELAVVIAPPGVGKSLYLVNQAVHDLMQGRKVLFITLEMPEDKVAKRFDSIMSLVPQAKINQSREEVKKRLTIFQQNFGGQLIIKEMPSGESNALTVRAYLNQLKNFQGFIPDVVYIDYLELLRPIQQGLPDHIGEQRIMEELKGVSFDFNFLTWTATQPNRDGRRVNVITDLELGNCYGKFRPPNLFISLNQDDEEANSGRIRVYVMKARDGTARYIVPMEVNYNNLRMKEIEKVDSTETDLDAKVVMELIKK